MYNISAQVCRYLVVSWFLLVVNQIDMVRGGPGSYKLKLNESSVEAEIHTLRDGGLLMQVSYLFFIATCSIYFMYYQKNVIYTV